MLLCSDHIEDLARASGLVDASVSITSSSGQALVCGTGGDEVRNFTISPYPVQTKLWVGVGGISPLAFSVIMQEVEPLLVKHGVTCDKVVRP